MIKWYQLVSKSDQMTKSSTFAGAIVTKNGLGLSLFKGWWIINMLVQAHTTTFNSLRQEASFLRLSSKMVEKFRKHHKSIKQRINKNLLKKLKNKLIMKSKKSWKNLKIKSSNWNKNNSNLLKNKKF